MTFNQSLPDELRQLARQKARHEYGHLIGARVLGFETGEVTLRVFGEREGYVGTSELFVHMPLASTAAISDWLERRVVVLFCGAMAEAISNISVGESYVEDQCFSGEGAASDHDRIHELIALHLNISQPDKMDAESVVEGRKQLYAVLRTRAQNLVKEEYALIDNLAADHVEKMKVVTRGWAWGELKADVDAKPLILGRFPKR